MNNYYIKDIWGPGAQEGYPYKENNSDNCLIYFSSKKGQECFRKCKGFLIYETGHKTKNGMGSKTIYAYGVIVSDQSDLSEYWSDIDEKKFPFPVRIRLQKRINPEDKSGVSLDIIRAILKSPKEKMQRPGGLIKITKEQFDQLSIELNKSL